MIPTQLIHTSYYFALLILLFQPLLHASQEPLIQRAWAFQIEEMQNGYKLKTFKENKLIQQVLLVRDSAQLNSKKCKRQNCLKIPLQSYASLSTTHLNSLSELDVLSSMSAFSRKQDVSNSWLSKQMQEGKIASLGLAESMNLEVLLKLAPQVVFTYLPPSDMIHKDLLERQGVVPVFVGEYLENNPLGYAEWILFFSVFFDKLEMAQKIYSGIQRRYLSLRKLASQHSREKTVLVNIPYAGTWYMPAKNGFMAGVLQDAGLKYIWAESKQGNSLKLSFEEVLLKSEELDLWLNPSDVKSKNELLAIDSRFALLRPFQTGMIWNNNLKEVQGQTNDFFETALARPDLLLKDLMIVFHPELFQGVKPRWYHRLK